MKEAVPTLPAASAEEVQEMVVSPRGKVSPDLRLAVGEEVHVTVIPGVTRSLAVIV